MCVDVGFKLRYLCLLFSIMAINSTNLCAQEEAKKNTHRSDFESVVKKYCKQIEDAKGPERIQSILEQVVEETWDKIVDKKYSKTELRKALRRIGGDNSSLYDFVLLYSWYSLLFPEQMLESPPFSKNEETERIHQAQCICCKLVISELARSKKFRQSYYQFFIWSGYGRLTSEYSGSGHSAHWESVERKILIFNKGFPKIKKYQADELDYLWKVRNLMIWLMLTGRDDLVSSFEGKLDDPQKLVDVNGQWKTYLKENKRLFYKDAKNWCWRPMPWTYSFRWAADQFQWALHPNSDEALNAPQELPYLISGQPKFPCRNWKSKWVPDPSKINIQ